MRKIFPLLLLALMHASIAHGEQQYVIRKAVEAGELKPLAEILAGVQARHAGKVVDVDLERGPGGQRVYEITLIKDNGQRAKIIADAVSGQEVIRAHGQAAPRLSLPKALKALLERHPGNILGVELKQSGERRLIYEVQLILHDGRLREFVVDAHDGKVLDGNGHRQEALKKLRSLPEIIERLPAHYRGTFLEIELEYDQDGRYFYEIEMRLADGRVFELDVDAVSGLVLNGEEVER